MNHPDPPLNFEAIAEQCSVSIALPSESSILWEQAMAILAAPNMEVVLKRFGVELRPDTFARILHEKEMDGDGIDSYIRSVASWQPQPLGKPIHVLNSCLWVYLGKLNHVGLTQAKRIFKKTLRKITPGSLILSPVCMNNHWTLIVLDLAEMKLDYYDSLQGKNSAGISIFLELFRDAGIIRNVDIHRPHDLPLQGAGDAVNCGPFVCSYAKAVIEGRCPSVSQEEMPVYRRTIALTILQEPPTPSLHRYQDYRDWCGISGQDYEEPEELVEANPIPTDQPRQEVLTEFCETKLRDISDGVDKFTMEEVDNPGKVRQANIPMYMPTYQELETLRNQDQPYVDIDEAGYEYTANTKGEWRNCLRMAEILSTLHKDEEKAWNALEVELTSNPSLALNWLANHKGKDKLRGPTSFRFGKKSNADRLRSILRKVHPGLATLSTQTKRGSVRSSAQRRERANR